MFKETTEAFDGFHLTNDRIRTEILPTEEQRRPSVVCSSNCVWEWTLKAKKSAKTHLYCELFYVMLSYQ